MRPAKPPISRAASEMETQVARGSLPESGAQKEAWLEEPSRAWASHVVLPESGPHPVLGQPPSPHSTMYRRREGGREGHLSAQKSHRPLSPEPNGTWGEPAGDTGQRSWLALYGSLTVGLAWTLSCRTESTPRCPNQGGLSVPSEWTAGPREPCGAFDRGRKVGQSGL